VGNNGDIRREAWRAAFRVQIGATEAVLHVEGRLGHDAAPQLKAAAEPLLTSGCDAVVLDVGRVDYISSAALRVLDALRDRLATDRRRLILRHATGPVKLALDLSGLADRVGFDPPPGS
jgi:anti-anti-sigma factor